MATKFLTKPDTNKPAQLQRLARRMKLACSMSWYDTLQKAKNIGADQTAQMRRLVCAFVAPKSLKTDFLASRPILYLYPCHIQPSEHTMYILFFFKILDFKYFFYFNISCIPTPDNLTEPYTVNLIIQLLKLAVHVPAYSN